MINSIDNVRLTGKKVLVRVDFNVPIDDNNKITDDTRIRESLHTINKIIDDGGIPILMSHLGRPKGEKNLKYSLQPVADYMHCPLGYKVIFSPDCIGEVAQKSVAQAQPGTVVLLENLRFYKEEEKNDLEFAKQLAALADVYVNDAFGTAHRAHASTYAVAKLFETRLAGYLIQNEITYLGKAIKNPIRPFTAVLGGSKISGKIDVIKSLFDKCDTILIGGGMMFTFLKAKGLEIGKSILEEDKIELAKELLKEAENRNLKLVLPVDVLVADKFDNSAQVKEVGIDAIPSDWFGMDIGSHTRMIFADIIRKSKTIVWNGPMGVFEMSNFAAGTFAIGTAMSEVTKKGAVTIVGGGDSAAAISQMKLNKHVTHVSTGGGASLEFLEGKELPGIAALEM